MKAISIHTLADSPAPCRGRRSLLLLPQAEGAAGLRVDVRSDKERQIALEVRLAFSKRDTTWKKLVSRRSLLKRSAIALGTVAVCEFEGIARAAQGSGSKTVLSEDPKESTMPHIIVKMYPGRTEQQKKQLTEAIVKDVVAVAGVGESSVSVAIEEIPPAEWTEKVYKPDIQSKWDKLYKKPGY